MNRRRNYDNIPFDSSRTRHHEQSRAFRRRDGKRTTSWKLQHPFLWLSGTVAILAVWYTTPVSDWTTDLVLLDIPIQADIELGRQAQHDLGRQYRTMYDPQWSLRIKKIGHQLVATAVKNSQEARYYDWDFGIVRDDAINAFCLPGGIVRVTSALLDTLQLSDSEMAALLGHEMGHVMKRHAQKRILSQHLLQYLLQALFYNDHDDQQESMGQALGELLLGATDWLGRQSFSRRDEYQADAVAWDLLVASRYNPQSLTSLLTKLWSLEDAYKSKTATSDSRLLLEQVESWSRTHPATKDRIQALQHKWESLPRKERQRLRRYPV